MKRSTNISLKVFIVAFALILIALPFHAFISTWGGTAIGPLLVWKSWKEILLFALIPLVILYFVQRPDIARLLWSRWVNRLIVAYMLLHIVMAAASSASGEAVIAGLLFNLRFLAMFLLAQIIVASAHPWVEAIKKHLVPVALWLAIILSLLAILQVTLLPKDFLAFFGYDKALSIAPYVLIDENHNALRAFATLRGPNTLGSYLLLPLALALALVVSQRRNVLAGAALGLGGVALALTGSRSAWLGAVGMLAVLAAIWVPRARLMHWAKVGIVPLLLTGAFGLWLAANVPAIRLAIFHSSPGDSSLLEGSSQKHWEATAEGAQEALARPLGQGVGSAGPASFYNIAAPPRIAENYFVQLAQEVGIAGLMLFVAICCFVAHGLWRQHEHLWPKILLASFAGLTIINVFLHGWADDPTAMTWWAIAGLYAFAHANIKKDS